MARTTKYLDFNVPNFTASFNAGDEIIFKLQLITTNTNDYTASFVNRGQVAISPVAVSTGYLNVYCPYLATGSAAGWVPNVPTNEIVFERSLSNLYGDNYQFVPNPPTGSASSSLYTTYGDVRYSFKPEQMDVVVMQLADNTFFVSTVTDVYRDTNNRIRMVMDRELPRIVINNISNLYGQTYKRFLLVKRYKNEQNIIVEFRKAPGDTSYGFIIPDTITQQVLDSINTIQATVQTQLLSTQVSTTFPIIS